MNWNEHLTRSEVNDCDKVFDLKKVPQGFKLEELIPGSLWVCHNNQPNENGYCSLDFCFFQYSYGSVDGISEVYATILFHGTGPTGSLKECRHTYWGEGGYIFYLNSSHIRKCLDWLEKYYEMD